MERRGHRFVRYANDANIYVRSRRAGERVMAGVERFLRRRLKLTLNREKNRVAGSGMCDYLGYGMSWHQQPRLRVATMSLGRLPELRAELLRGARGHKFVSCEQWAGRRGGVPRQVSDLLQRSGIDLFWQGRSAGSRRMKIHRAAERSTRSSSTPTVPIRSVLLAIRKR
ncbi:hypothetical protein EMIT0196MI5_70132 [Pseudomonas sp. IT-196MI5]